jgi:hypothetical protein
MADKVLQPADVSSLLYEVKQAVLLPSPDYVVSGTELYNGWFLKAKRIVFKSGAKLVFSLQAQDKRNLFWVVAQEIVSEDGQAPGVISWQPRQVGDVGAAGGQAPTGAHAGIDDHPGGRGSDGAAGPTGYPGNSAPALTIITFSVPGSGPEINFQGQTGGTGGQGQQGGDGGNGAKGHPATATPFGCRNGAGSGGAGADGGTGGKGGTGGTGGKGGTVTLVSDAALLPGLTAKFRVRVSGGQGGSVGRGGKGGSGGVGGPRGAPAFPFCSDDGHDGTHGNHGQDGPNGDLGSPGSDGDTLVGAITKEEFDYVWGGNA